MLRHIAEENLPHRITLVYSNRDRESAAFLDELAALGRNNPNLDIVLTMTEDPAWEGSHDASMPISCTTTWATIWAHSRTSSQARP